MGEVLHGDNKQRALGTFKSKYTVFLKAKNMKKREVLLAGVMITMCQIVYSLFRKQFCALLTDTDVIKGCDSWA